eukprot:TRINITY_DN614_c0_g1_i1.p1 TRINITY_DN614_c0_g1~~TRINITY_DN614_c0_g1_i1.p1  ORF type:complete len:386 (-),score=73.32 TRINITY_DN614_c0_g1_i1:2078-3235(-)
MAFLPQLPLPARGSPRLLSPSVAIPTRVNGRVAVVVGRRRRVYGVVSSPSTSQIVSTVRVETVCSASKRDEIRRALMQRMQERNKELKKSDMKRELSFKQQLSDLRNPKPAPSPAPVNTPDKLDVPSGAQLDPTHELPSVPDRDLLAPPPQPELLSPPVQPELLSPPVQPELLSQAPQRDLISGNSGPGNAAVQVETTKPTGVSTSQKAGVEQLYGPPSSEPKGKPQSTGVDELYSPPSSKPEEEPLLDRAFQTIARTVETIVEETKDGIDDVIESFSDSAEEVIAKDPEKKDIPSKKPGQTDSGAKEGRSIGKVLLDAIVEGVPSKEKEVAPPVDKTDLIFLVESGKIKSLTVSKLRRLLSANNLKTSGRKAELIARLTSFAKQ